MSEGFLVVVVQVGLHRLLRFPLPRPPSDDGDDHEYESKDDDDKEDDGDEEMSQDVGLMFCLSS